MKKYHEKDTDLVSFLDSMFIEKGLSKNTVSSYKSDILDAFNWSMLNHKVSLKKIKNYEIEAYIKYLFDKNYKSTTVNRKISSLKAFFLFLLKNSFKIYSVITEINKKFPNLENDVIIPIVINKIKILI